MSKYSEALKVAKPSLIMRRELFQKYMKQIVGEPLRVFIDYFYDQGYMAWRYKVNNNDLKQVEFVEWICSQLDLKHKTIFLETASLVLEEANNIGNILRESERKFYEADEAGSDAKIKNALDHYKTFFESVLRLWATLPYLYASKILGVKSRAATADGFLRVSSGTKYEVLRKRSVFVGKGVLSDLVSTFSKKMRNAGGGHDSYEFLDGGKVKLRVNNPKSGKAKEVLILSYGDIVEAIDKARKAVWILRNGLMIFLNKNPKILRQLSRINPIKLRDVEKSIKSISNERWLSSTDFLYSEKDKRLSLTIEKEKRFSGKSTELLFGSGERFEVISVATEVTLKGQVLGILQHAAFLMSSDYPLEEITVSYRSDADKTYKVAYKVEDLLTKSKNIQLIKPVSGELPDEKYEMVSELSVPFGSRSFMELQLKLKGYKVI